MFIVTIRFMIFKNFGTSKKNLWSILAEVV